MTSRGSDPSFEAFQPGAIVDGKYRILSTIGGGSMGRVLLGEDVALQRLVALKVLDPRSNEAVLAYFRHEAAAMARIRHPNVAQVYSFGEEQGLSFFAMEYVPGENMRAFIDRQDTGHGLPVDVVLGVVRQVCDGLAEVHRQGLVHHDVKPENIIIGPGYRVCLVDFGVSQPLAKGVPELAGTPPYIAPEVVIGTELPPDQRHLSDVFSVGVVTFELLTGAQPFRRPSQMSDIAAMLQELAQQNPTRLAAFRPDLGPGYEEVLARAMARAPTDRFADCEALVAGLVEARSAVQRARRGGRCVLAVDDDPDICVMYKTVLEAVVADVLIETAADGLVAFELAKAHDPALIIVDLNMPRVNGLELCGLLRGLERLVAVPIVVISAELTIRTRQALANLGVAEMVPKPIKPRQLAELAQRYL